jgi:thioredoxin 1
LPGVVDPGTKGLISGFGKNLFNKQEGFTFNNITKEIDMLLFKRKFILALLLVVGIMAAGQFHSGYAQAKRPALYEFGAGHCISCKEMEKVISELKTTLGDKVEFRMLYADKEKPLFQQYKIMLIPTQVFLNAEGKEVDRHVGALTKEQVLAKLKELKFIAN